MARSMASNRSSNSWRMKNTAAPMCEGSWDRWVPIDGFFSLVAKLETLPHAFDAVRAGSRHLVFEGDTVVHSEMGVLADVGDAVVGSPTVGLNFRTGGNMLDDEREQVQLAAAPAMKGGDGR
ncbi:hypothetical protein PRIPAC_72834 [Pristionchus pacificus]|uniref:Uncharacterized protein n=1 Tax=Pristionchus pacificus TaxID=54126 RepID=A0A2A6BF78_PRIPA|nr:hypothetical protein PRIPAC_72834 [Pristionchus pacificus]|eukprot:PDM64461.1 hypothetical protein PRIPAC_52717 [Pristionchus pacificus]